MKGERYGAMVDSNYRSLHWWNRWITLWLYVPLIWGRKSKGRKALGTDAPGALRRGGLRERDREDALTYYRKNLGAGEPAHFDPFPKG